jgi:hypothetical protein
LTGDEREKKMDQRRRGEGGADLSFGTWKGLKIFQAMPI